MRSITKRLRTALGLFATAMIASLAMGATLAPAQTQFTSLTGFGDSYADTGTAPGGAFRLINALPYWPCPEGYTSCRFTGSTNFNDTLQSIYHLPGLTNYSIGGARTDNTNTMPPIPNNYGLPYELYQFALSGTRFKSSDLITISIGGNDLSAVPNIASLQSSAIQSAQYAVNGGIVINGFQTGGIQQLVAAGAHNIAWLSTGSTKWFPEPPVGAAGPLNSTQRDLWANTYYQQTQQLLAPFAQSGVRIFLFNFGILQERVANNPGQYGFVSATSCEQGAPSPTSPLNTGINFYLQGCFYNNSVHPTGQAMALIAAYMANQIDAPTTVVPQGDITTSIATGFASSVLGRLDADRTFQPFATGAAMAMSYAMPTKAPIEPFAPIPVEKRWSMYSDVTFASGARTGQSLASGYDVNAVGGTLGVEYRPDRRWRVGGVFAYSEPNVSLGVQNAHDHITAYQFAGYGSFTDTNWFADALVAYGRHDFALARAGIIDTVHASTHANTFTTAARAGYLTDFGSVRAGPIAGLNYTHAVIDGYTENGDILLTMAVDRQALDALTGSAGLQVRYPFLLGNVAYSPFINLTVEHDFLGSGRILTTTLVTAPLLPILTPVPDGGNHTYGKVAGGIAAAVTGSLSATLTAATSFARDGGNDFAISGGIKAAF